MPTGGRPVCGSVSPSPPPPHYVIGRVVAIDPSRCNEVQSVSSSRSVISRPPSRLLVTILTAVDRVKQTSLTSGRQVKRTTRCAKRYNTSAESPPDTLLTCIRHARPPHIFDVPTNICWNNSFWNIDWIIICISTGLLLLL